MYAFEYQQPKSVADAAAALARTGGKALAGGQSLVAAMKLRLAQGIGQALMEACVYDRDSGQLLTASYMDYTMPRAGDLPSFKVATEVTPCTHNPLGVKGCGEAGAIGAPAAVMNAVVDALAPVGVRDMQMPATPARVWGAIQERRST